jgi:hypothetical protein
MEDSRVNDFFIQKIKKTGFTLPLYDRPPSPGLTGKKINAKLGSF